MESLLSLIGQNLAKFRKQKGFTQESFAKEAGVSRATVARYESGEGGIDAKTIALFAKSLGIKETDLVVVSVSSPYALLDAYLERHPTHKKKVELPTDILDDLEHLDPRLRDTAINMFRTVLSGLKGTDKKSQSEAG